jgi:hypothetical protein
MYKVKSLEIVKDVVVYLLSAIREIHVWMLDFINYFQSNHIHLNRFWQFIVSHRVVFDLDTFVTKYIMMLHNKNLEF